jgi:FkbM family methyltransferase
MDEQRRMSERRTKAFHVEASFGAATLVAPADDYIATKLAEGRFYEADLLEEIAEMRIRGTYVDVGAHIGNHTVAFALMGCRRVVALEPQPQIHALLASNVVLNGLLHRVVASRAVVHDRWVGASPAPRPGDLQRLREGLPNSGATAFVSDDRGCSAVTSIDSAVRRDDVRLIKVDVEGEELAVLRSAARVIHEQRPVIICEAQTQERFAELDEHLRGLRYVTDGRARCATPTYVWRWRGERDRSQGR